MGGIDEKRRGLVFKRKAKVEIEDKKFLKVGQKFRSRRDRQNKKGFHDSRRRGGVEEKLRWFRKKKRVGEGKLM